jgi:regulator of protease activity HflC (stomatin/prohibitin superfamily)
MFLFGFIFLLITVAGVVMSRALRSSDKADERSAGVGFGVFSGIAGFLAVLFLVWSCIAVVSTRNVGIITSFGKPVGHADNGLHVKLPWHHISELDGTIQTDSQVGAFDQTGRCANGTPVRLANNSTACVDNTIRWRINPSAADELFRDYQDTANIRDSLVTRELNSVLNQVFASYNPLGSDAAAGPNLADLAQQTTDKLKAKIGGQIEVQNVIISIIHFDGQTQDKINQFQGQIADTRIATQKQQTAAAEATANQILSASVDNSSNVLVSKCLDMVAVGKVQLPVGFNCWPGAGVPLSIPAR